MHSADRRRSQYGTGPSTPTRPAKRWYHCAQCVHAGIVRDRRGGDFRPPNTVCGFVRSRRCKPSVGLLRVCARCTLPQQSGGQGGRPVVGRGQETQGRGRCSIDAAVSACSSPVQNTEQENTRTKGLGDQRRPAAQAERFRRCSAAGSFGDSNGAVPNAAEPRAAAAPKASGSHS